MHNDEQRQQIIDAITAKVKQELDPTQAAAASHFIEQFYGTLSVEDLLARDANVRYGAALTQWRHSYHRQPGDTHVRVYNPSYEVDGWYSPHTIVQVSHDDMPFLVDSIRMEINRHGFNVHLIVHFGGMRVVRDGDGKITEVLPLATPASPAICLEAPIYLEIDRQTDQMVLTALRMDLLRVLADVRVTVEDWQPMLACVNQALAELDQANFHSDADEVVESKDFLRWLVDEHFTFLGCRQYQLTNDQGEQALDAVPGTGLGVLREEKQHSARLIASLTKEARNLLFSQKILIISKTNTRATVHRPVYTDYIGIKRFDKNGQVRGELRIVGLYTSAAYNANPMQIPFVRRNIARIVAYSGLPPKGHAQKVLVNILETLPRDDLFQATVDELSEIAMGILSIQERQCIRFFMRKDVYNRFVSCLIYVPKDRFNTLLRKAFQYYLMDVFKGTEVSFSTLFSDSVLARIHFIIRTEAQHVLVYDVKEIERDLIVIGRVWLDDVKDLLCEHYGEEHANVLFARYGEAFRSSYREDFPATEALLDIEHMEKLSDSNNLEMRFCDSADGTFSHFEIKILHVGDTMPLSDVVPILENLGLRIISESPYQIHTNDNLRIWISNFRVVHADAAEFSIHAIKDSFQEAFRRVWVGEMENDGFNRLVLAAQLRWRQISILRAYTKYLWQIGFTFSQSYIEETLAKNPTTVKLLIDLFMQRLDPTVPMDKQATDKILALIGEELDGIASLDEDRILRRLLDVINATLRTNYFQSDAEGNPKTYIACKLESAAIPDMPVPVPLYEIFVCSPRFEGIHLRHAKVARGGIRWSDRREDFRTEVLGLMKAQVLKNAVIVPSGAKGGFVPKCLPGEGGRDAIMAEVIDCYRYFIRGLLDITDNVKDALIVHPHAVKCYDGDDPYLVVAADKGTATFSDIANAIAQEYDFWLDDAFASGGSTGYDHKKMAITARGAWVSVERHFRELGINIQTADFTAVGIGDMSGDVFGNGMLLSQRIKLVAAFDHRHIFLDPNPNPAISYQERLRLFNAPRSNWQDYAPNLISAGGGVYSRSLKAIELSPQVQMLLGVQAETMVPTELIKAILQAPVDLLWNGGIGTYVKSSTEGHTDVGDRTNDTTRINANQLRCKVVGEGGNLGFTQLARVEYALQGGKINTDAMDNSGGVDCSDHEVNIKILLNAIVRDKQMTLAERNRCLIDMTDDVAKLVLHNNYMQTLAISIADTRASSYLDLFARYMQTQEHAGRLKRSLDFLPSDKEIFARKSVGKSLTRPEIVVLLAHSKSALKAELLASTLPEDAYLSRVVEMAFPHVLRERFPQQIAQHRLRREIIATQISNIMINEVGINFIYRLQDETGSNVSSIVKAYSIVRAIFQLPSIWRAIEALDYHVAAELQYTMLIETTRLTRRATRWLLRTNRASIDVGATIAHFAGAIGELMPLIASLSQGSDLADFQKKRDEYVQQGVPVQIAVTIASMTLLFSALDIVQIAMQQRVELSLVGKVYFMLSDKLGLGWLRKQVAAYIIENRWSSLMREMLRDDLDWQQRALTIAVLTKGSRVHDVSDKFTLWTTQHKELLVRWEQMLGELHSHVAPDFLIYAVAIRELLDLAQASAHSDMAQG